MSKYIGYQYTKEYKRNRKKNVNKLAVKPPLTSPISESWRRGYLSITFFNSCHILASNQHLPKFFISVPIST